MLTTLSLIDARILLALNHALARHPALYGLGLALTDHVADALTLLTLLALWFWPDPKQRTVLKPVKLKSKAKPRGPLAMRRNRELRRAMSAMPSPPISRLESRAQLITFAAAALAAYVASRVAAQAFDVDRPFNSYLPVMSGTPGAFIGLRTYGSFPSDHAALLAAFPLAMFFWNRALGYTWMVFGIVLMVVRVAVGFHYPSDMLGGGIIGLAFVGSALILYRRNTKWQAAMDAVARGFEVTNAPYCYFLYGLAGVVGLEFVMHFRHVLEMVHHMQGELAWRF